MIIVREVFTARPGMASQLARLFVDALKADPGRVRVMTDLVGQFNTVVLESEYDSFEQMQKRMEEYRTNQDMRNKMAGYTEMYLEGRREIYEVVG